MPAFRPAALMLCLSALFLSSVHADELDDRVDTLVRALMSEQALTGVAVGITAPGRRRLYYAGTADARGDHPVDERTLFEIGSLSKAYTATLGAYAAETGALTWQQTAGQIDPALAGTPLGQATLLQLATYTAGGLPLQFPDAIEKAGTAEGFYQRFQPPFPAGSWRLYSNPSIGLFGALAAARLGQSYATALRDRIVAPLRLEHTYLDVPADRQGDYAWGHKDGKPIRVSPGLYAAEAYGIKTTAGDLLSFVDAQLDQTGLPQPLAQAVRATHIGRYRTGPMTQALGWERYPYPLPLERLLAGNTAAMALEPQPVTWLAAAQPTEGAWLFNKTGSTNGFGAYALFVPERHLGVVILANRNYPITARVATAYRILQALDTPPPRIPKDQVMR